MTTPDARVYALSKASIDALQAVGVWDTAVDARDGCGIYLNMQVGCRPILQYVVKSS